MPDTQVVNTMTSFAIINKDTPDYIMDALEFFSLLEGGGDQFRELVELWQVFKLRMGYPGGIVSTNRSNLHPIIPRLIMLQKPADHLPMEHRLDEVKQWIKNGCD